MVWKHPMRTSIVCDLQLVKPYSPLGFLFLAACDSPEGIPILPPTVMLIKLNIVLPRMSVLAINLDGKGGINSCRI